MPKPPRLCLGGDANDPPFHFRNHWGEAYGFDFDLAQGIAADLGLDLVGEPSDWPETLERLGRGELDAVPMLWSRSAHAVSWLRCCHGVKPASIPGEHFVNARLVQ